MVAKVQVNFRWIFGAVAYTFSVYQLGKANGKAYAWNLFDTHTARAVQRELRKQQDLENRRSDSTTYT